METENEKLKQLVKEKYSRIAEQDKQTNASSCCGATACCSSDSVLMADDYTAIDGYMKDADLGLGCGLPTEYANIKQGDVVVDLGSGAGNDAFVARSIVGENGKVIGIDFTETMIQKARDNARKLHYTNVEFIQGDIEHLPLADNTANVVVSNCVLNLVPNKKKAFAETFRVLKSGGHFSISDVVLDGDLPKGLQRAAEMYVGCVSGAVQKNDYLDIVRSAGFIDVALQKEKEVTIPDEILDQHLSLEERKKFKESNSKIISITLYAVKQQKAKSCCGPECCN